MSISFNIHYIVWVYFLSVPESEYLLLENNLIRMVIKREWVILLCLNTCTEYFHTFIIDTYFTYILLTFYLLHAQLVYV